MKRYISAVIFIFLLAFTVVCAYGAGSVSVEYRGNYAIMMPEGKTNKDLSDVTGGVVYNDSALTSRASETSVTATGKYLSVSCKRYEIIVIGDSDGDGFILNSDLLSLKNSFEKNSQNEREKIIFDANENGRITATDYILMKAHFLGISKLTGESPSTENSEESSVDPDWVNQCTIRIENGIPKISGNGAYVSGKTINITQGGEYTISGNLAGGIVVNSSEKVKIRLSGVEINNSNGPAILLDSAKKAYITIDNGTVNSLSDGVSYSDGKGTIHSEVDLEIKGKGTLYVSANYKHAISCDKDLIVENGIIKIEKAVKDGIHSKNSVEISGGEITLENCLGDGIDCEGNSSLQKGTVSITGGKLTMSAISGDGINALGNVTISAGTVNIISAQDCIKSDALVTISGTSALVLKAGSDGVNAKKGINVTGGSATVSAVEYTLKSDLNVNATGGSLSLEGGMSKIYALGTINVKSGVLK